jgi:aspartyl-tRNA(Asn)/glutamyl-tRNA(Gln) amidotransferase subunit A
MVSPTCPTTAFKIGEKSNDPIAMYLNDIATIPVNMAGIGGMSVPSGLAPEDGLPVGFQIMAPAMQDQRMYLVGAALEAALLTKWGAPLLSQAPALVGK